MLAHLACANVGLRKNTWLRRCNDGRCAHVLHILLTFMLTTVALSWYLTEPALPCNHCNMEVEWGVSLCEGWPIRPNFKRLTSSR